MHVNCSLLGTLFVTAILCALANAILSPFAWRNRLPQYSSRRWTWDPTCMFRTRYYQQPPPRIRLAAIAVQVVGALCLLVVALAFVSLASPPSALMPLLIIASAAASAQAGAEIARTSDAKTTA